MKLIDGRTWADLLRDRDGPGDDLARHLHVFEQVCQTVAYAHGQGVVHRDLKPANVMVGAFGEVQVMDWGLAIEPASQERPRPDLPTSVDAPGSANVTAAATDTGQVVGTPAYMPPEQALGRDKIDARADVFALGAILCEVLTGEAPYRGPYAVVASRAADLADADRALAACGAAPELTALARRCLSPDPADRPTDAGAVAEAMTAYRRGVEARLREAERERAAAEVKAAEQRKRRRVQGWLTAAVALLLAGGGAFAWYADRQANARRAELSVRAGSARDALGAALDQAEKSLRIDRPAEADIALAEASRRLDADPHADPDEALAKRHADLADQAAFLRELGRIRDLMLAGSEGQFYARDLGTKAFAAAFRDRGLDTTRPDAVRERLAAWAIRDQILAALDLWLSGEPGRADLVALLAGLDPDGSRDAWRAAVASGGAEHRLRLAERLVTGTHPPRFIAAYAAQWPRKAGLAMLRAGWEKQPDNLPLAAALGDLLRQGPHTLGDQAEAVGFYRVCLGIRPNHAPTHVALGTVSLDRNDFDAAVATFRTAVALDPRYAPGHYELGRALRAKNDLDGAEAAYRQALAVDPGFTSAWNNLGNVLCDKKDLDGGIAAFRKALALDKDHVKALNNLGVALRDRKVLDGAVAAYRQALAVDPKNPDVLVNLGNALLDGKDTDGAVDAYRRAIAGNPGFVLAHHNLGVALRAKGDLDGAINSYRRTLAINPRYVRAYNSLGVALMHKDDLDGAIEAFRLAITIEPRYALPHCNLGECLRKQGRFVEAVAALQRGHELGSEVPNWERPSGQELREARRLLELDARLPRLLEGAEEPATASEAVEFARLCSTYRQRHAVAVRLYELAFRLDAALAPSHRHEAARAALRASDAGRQGLRQQALAWLRADLAAWRALPPTDPLAAQVPDKLGRWLKEADLASVREPDALAKLPDDERRAWEAFWADVRRTLDEVQPKGP